MRLALLSLAVLPLVALLGPLSQEASACTPSQTLTYSNPALLTVVVGVGTGGSGPCATASYTLGYFVSCSFSPGGLAVGPYAVSAGPVTILVDTLVTDTWRHPLCNHNVVVLP